MKKILFVDDEVQILRSINRVFLDSDFELFVAENGMQALEILQQQEIDMIISDMRMPVMDGYELLSLVRLQYPKVLRVVISGHSDEKVIFHAIQQNIAKIYLFKPWNNEVLLKLVGKMLETEDLLTANNLFLLMNNFGDLPAVKQNHAQILSLIDSDAELSEIAKEIERDLSISAQVLHIANSSFYGVRTGSVKHAVSFLGLQNIRSITVSTSLMESMKISGDAKQFADNVWEHGFVTNRVMHFIYEKIMRSKVPSLASSAGLLHNIGIVFMLKNFTQDYLNLIQKAEQEQISSLGMEMEAFKVDHQQTGGYLLHWWELPIPIFEAALYHHTPFDERIIHTELLAVVHIAQKYAWDILKITKYAPFYPETFEVIGVSQEQFESELWEIDWM